MGLSEERYHYDMECLRCNTVTTYLGLDKKEPYKNFYNVMMKRFDHDSKLVDWNGIEYEFCEECELMTRQQLICFDPNPEFYVIDKVGKEEV